MTDYGHNIKKNGTTLAVAGASMAVVAVCALGARKIVQKKMALIDSVEEWLAQYEMTAQSGEFDKECVDGTIKALDKLLDDPIALLCWNLSPTRGCEGLSGAVQGCTWILCEAHSDKVERAGINVPDEFDDSLTGLRDALAFQRELLDVVNPSSSETVTA